MNRVELAGTIVECLPLRYTPAGIAVIDLVLEHASVVTEAGSQRSLSLRMPARSIGAPAVALAATAIGSTIRAFGFLARKSHRSKSILFHIQHFQAAALNDSAAPLEPQARNSP